MTGIPEGIAHHAGPRQPFPLRIDAGIPDGKGTTLNAANSAAVPSGTILDDLATLKDRLTTSAGRLISLDQETKNERKLRDRLIVRAVDQAHMPQSVVAKLAGVSQPHVVRILAAAGQDDD